MMKTKRSLVLELLDGFITVYLPVSIGLSPNTVTSYKCTFRLLLQFLNDEKGVSADKVSFSMLDYTMLMSFFTWLRTERSCGISTQNQRFAALATFSKYAQNRNFDAASVFRNAVLNVKLKKPRCKPRAFFSCDELKILFSLPDTHSETGYRDLVLLSVMYASGVRAQEICDMIVGSVQFDSKGAVLSITGKGQKTRRCRIAKSCSDLLQQYIAHRGIAESTKRHVFSSQTHEHMTVSCVEGVFKKYVIMAKTQHPTLFPASSYPPHSMRHTTASHMLEAGVPLTVIKNFLGHASLMSTQVYAEMSQGAVNAHIVGWNAKWFPDEASSEPVAPLRPSPLPDFLK